MLRSLQAHSTLTLLLVSALLWSGCAALHSPIGEDEPTAQVSDDTEPLHTLNEKATLGYGITLSQEKVAGNVHVLTPEDNQTKQTATDLADLLEGRVSGVYVANDGSIHIRGASSFQGNAEPLYVVDGMPLTSRPHIDPRTVESISVLKDAETRALYGSRGANGVIVISTKMPEGS